MKESELQKLILSYLKKAGYKAWKNYLGPLMIQGGRRAINPNSGQPDIFGLKKDRSGKLFAIELKSDTGKLSDKQREEIGELEKNGVFVIAARDFETVKNNLEKWELSF